MEALLRLFQAALDMFWTRTKTTLGEVTVTAIAARVLYVASEKFSVLSSLKVEETGGIQCTSLRERGPLVDRAELLAGIRFVLVEILTVLGNLTDDILTPELHAALSKLTLPKAARAKSGAKPKTAGAKREDKRR